ncbi:hypothetical protein LSAT2_000154 [Lamellibrachia satsuma]|nr:hypothetical protein LSAT2_000154 [Lamellibrachia satsuma]
MSSLHIRHLIEYSFTYPPLRQSIASYSFIPLDELWKRGETSYTHNSTVAITYNQGIERAHPTTSRLMERIQTKSNLSIRAVRAPTTGLWKKMGKKTVRTMSIVSALKPKPSQSLQREMIPPNASSSSVTKQQFMTKKETPDDKWTARTPWLTYVSTEARSAASKRKLFPDTSRINKMATREKQLQQEERAKSKTKAEDMSKSAVAMARADLTSSTSLPQKVVEPDVPRDLTKMTALAAETRRRLDPDIYFATGNPKINHDFFDQTMSYDARASVDVRNMRFITRPKQSDISYVVHPEYKNSYNKSEEYRKQLLQDMKKIKQPIVKPRHVPERCPVKVSRLDEPVGNLETYLLRLLAQQQLERSLKDKMPDVSNATTEWIGPKQMEQSGLEKRRSSGQMLISRSNFRSEATRHRQQLDKELSTTAEDRPTSGPERHTRSSLLQQRKMKENNPFKNARLCEDTRKREEKNLVLRRPTIFNYHESGKCQKFPWTLSKSLTSSSLSQQPKPEINNPRDSSHEMLTTPLEPTISSSVEPVAENTVDYIKVRVASTEMKRKLQDVPLIVLDDKDLPDTDETSSPCYSLAPASKEAPDPHEEVAPDAIVLQFDGQQLVGYLVERLAAGPHPFALPGLMQLLGLVAL